MHKKRGIVIFVVLFCLVMLAPFLVNLNNPATDPVLNLQTSPVKGGKTGECVAPTDQMMSSHMQMLDQWRNQVVRNAQTTYTSASGETFSMSLDQGCLQCHVNRQEFCDSCHNYAGVDPYCWQCHENQDSVQKKDAPE